ncbi:hypothetical protein QFZ76_000661 [Streptomyces sp. V4I2]|nr:hypothetical protein [Streptomyces sp. V4I2]
MLRGSARGITTSLIVTFDQDSLGIALTAGRGYYGFAR